MEQLQIGQSTYLSHMKGIQPPGAIRGPAPRLDTVHRVEAILRAAAARDEGPLPLAEIKRRLPSKSVRHSTVRTCVDELARLGLVTADPAAGVMWTLHEDPAFWAKKRVVL